MRCALLPLLTLATLASFVSAAGKCSANPNEPESRVQVLKDLKLFKSWAKRKGSPDDPLISMVNFCKADDPDCKALNKEYEKMAFKLSEKGFEFGSVDCSVPKAKEICQEAKVTKFPTLKVYRDGKMSKYLHERTVETMSKYLMRQVKGAFREIENTPKQIAAFKKSEDFTVLGSFTDKDSSAFKAYKQAAKNISIDYTFGYTFGNSNDKIATHSNAFEFETTFSPLDVDDDEDKFTKDAIIDFVKTAALPLIGDLDEKNFPLYQAMKLPIGFTYIHDKNDHETMLELFTPLAKKYRGIINFLFIDGTKFDEDDDTSSKKKKKAAAPNFVINEFEPEFYTYPLNADLLTKDGKSSLAKFLNKFVKGEMKPVVESDPVPETNNGLVKVVVGDSFNELVMNTDKE
ncbi:protein disulfide-isomerase precursor, partial [Rhizoclosmatium hyalinum]